MQTDNVMVFALINTSPTTPKANAKSVQWNVKTAKDLPNTTYKKKATKKKFFTQKKKKKIVSKLFF